MSKDSKNLAINSPIVSVILCLYGVNRSKCRAYELYNSCDLYFRVSSHVLGDGYCVF